MQEIEELHFHLESAADGFGRFVAAYGDGLKSISCGDRVSYDWQSTSRTVRRFMEGDFRHLCRSLEILKTLDCDDYAGQFAETLSKTMLRLGEVTSSEWKRFGVALRRDFTWSAQILLAVFRPKSFMKKHMPRAFAGRVSAQEFRRRVVDRILVVLRGILSRLRDYAQLVDQKVERISSPFIPAGHKGLLMARLLDGRYDYLDSTRWRAMSEPSSWFDRLEEKVDTAFDRMRWYLQRCSHRPALPEHSV